MCIYVATYTYMCVCVCVAFTALIVSKRVSLRVQGISLVCDCRDCGHPQCGVISNTRVLSFCYIGLCSALGEKAVTMAENDIEEVAVCTAP